MKELIEKWKEFREKHPTIEYQSDVSLFEHFMEWLERNTND